MTEPVTILMPVGPNYNPEWLEDAIDSLFDQNYTKGNFNLLLIDDGAQLNYSRHNIPQYDIYTDFIRYGEFGSIIFPRKYGEFEEIIYCKLPTTVGFAAAFNLGMALSNNNLVMFLAADDRLMPDAVEKAVQCYLDHDRKDAWYACSYVDSNGNKSSIPNNLALTTKHFFLDMCGGYPPAGFVGPDALLLSCLLAHAPDRIIKVADGTPLYWIRDHDQQETKTHTWKFVDEMNSIRNKVTREFKLKDG